MPAHRSTEDRRRLRNMRPCGSCKSNQCSIVLVGCLAFILAFGFIAGGFSSIYIPSYSCGQNTVGISTKYETSRAQDTDNTSSLNENPLTTAGTNPGTEGLHDSFHEEYEDGTLIWLMSFPNSGTSFTSKMVRHYSMMSTATNYGEELVHPVTKESMPVFENTSHPPFWIDSKSYYHNDQITRPTRLIFTKTHCGGRCEKCGPNRFMETPHSFQKRCLEGRTVVRREGKPVLLPIGAYDIDLVKKAVHIVRDPISNLVSRFHLEHHHYVEQNSTEKLQAFPANRTGFRSFCKELDARFAAEEWKSRLVDRDALELIKDVPCHLDIFRYVAWHNLAFCTTASMRIETMVLHYERYETDLEKTAIELMNFLELEPRGSLIEFYKGKEYGDYYDPEEREAIKRAIKKLSLKMTWEQLVHYFE